MVNGVNLFVMCARVDRFYDIILLTNGLETSKRLPL